MSVRKLLPIALMMVLACSKSDRPLQSGAAAAGDRLGGEEKEFEGIAFVWIPPGSFLMGSSDPEDSADQGPVRRVTISRGFWMSKCEITIGQWNKVMDNDRRGDSI